MHAMVVFERQGARGVHRNVPLACNQCQFSAGSSLNGIFWDTARDALQFYRMWRNPTMTQIWKNIWNAFTCPPPGKNCNVKQACGPRPVFIEGGANAVRDPADGNIRWQLYMIIGREIQCVKEGNGEDVSIDIPDPPRQEPPQPPSPGPTASV